MELGLGIEFKEQIELGLGIEEQRLDGARFRDRRVELRWSQVQGQSYKDQMELGLGIEFKDWMKLGLGIEFKDQMELGLRLGKIQEWRINLKKE